MTLWGILWGGGFTGKLKGSKSLRKFANIRCIEAKEAKRNEVNEAEGAWLLNFGIKGYEKERGRGGCTPVVHGAYYNLYVQESLSFGGGSPCSIFAMAALFGLFPLSGTKLTSLFVRGSS